MASTQPTLVVADYVCLAIYLAGTLLLGLWVGRRVRSGTDLFLAGRSLPWWAIGFSLVATDIGGTDIIGVGGSAYTHGLAVANFEWIGCVPAMIIAAFVFVPHFWRSGITTIPEFFERRFNASVRTAVAVCWLAFMACNLGVMLLASARLLSALLGWNEVVCILSTAALVGIYTVAGGLAAVVYTDVVQCVVMIAGCLLVVVLGVVEVGGVGPLREKVAEVVAHRQEAERQKGVAPLPRGEEDSPTALVQPVKTRGPYPWTAIFFGLALVLSPGYWIGNQAIIQRALGARSEFEAKAGYVWGAVLKNLIPFIVAVPGLIAVVRFPELQDGDQAVPRLVGDLLPAGLRGIFLAAFLAALMSSVDSYLNSSATVFTEDLYKRFLRPGADDRQLLLAGRLVTVGVLAWGICFALALTTAEAGIYAIFQTLIAFFSGPALVVLLCGLFWRRATGTGALAGFLSGVATSVLLFLLNQPFVYESLGTRPLFRIADPFLYLSVWASLVTLGMVLVVSLLTRPEPAEKLAQMIRAPVPSEAP
jgi:solute:Na+ symporter, SSS family